MHLLCKHVHLLWWLFFIQSVVLVVLVNSENQNFSNHGFFVYELQKPCELFCLKPLNIFEKYAKSKINQGASDNFTVGLCTRKGSIGAILNSGSTMTQSLVNLLWNMAQSWVNLTPLFVKSAERWPNSGSLLIRNWVWLQWILFRGHLGVFRTVADPEGGATGVSPL